MDQWFRQEFKSDNERAGYAMRWIGHEGETNKKPFFNSTKPKTMRTMPMHCNIGLRLRKILFSPLPREISPLDSREISNKWEGQGKFLMDGSLPENDWQSYIPQQFNAHTKNPARGL